MIDYAVISVTEPNAWHDSLADVPHSFHHTWEWARAMQATTGYPTNLFVTSSEDGMLACPFVERPVANELDVATPSGLGGFVAAGAGALLATAWDRFVTARGYVSGYIGLHPLFEPPGLPYEIARLNSLYALDLSLGLEGLRTCMDQNRRRQLRGWEQRAEGFVRDRGAIAEFLVDRYESFMRSVGARDPHLAPETLELLAHSESCYVVGAAPGGTLQAASVFAATDYAGDFLFSVATEAGRRHATDLLWYGVKVLSERGVPILNLGGGAKEDDGVARSKQRFRPMRFPLGAVRQIYDPRKYADLCRRAGVAPTVREGFFPGYRSPSATRLQRGGS